MAGQPTTEIQGIEIFDKGVWAGRGWDTGHIDEMVSNFDKLSTRLKAPVKLGHDDNQILAQRDGQPALGWINRLYRKGEKLLADLSDVPHLLVDLIRKRRYRTVSSEIIERFENSNAERNLKTGVRGHVLTAVGLLGADLPEVKTLEDLATVLASENDATPVHVTYSPPDGGTIVEMAAGNSPEVLAEFLAEFDDDAGFTVKQDGDGWVLCDADGDSVATFTGPWCNKKWRSTKKRKKSLSDDETGTIHASVGIIPDSPESTSTDSKRTDMEQKDKPTETTPKDDETLQELQAKLAAAEQKITASESESAALKARVEAAEKRQAAAEEKATAAAAEQFIAKYRRPECLKIFNDEQADVVRTLYCQKSTEVIKLSDKDGKETVASVAGLLAKFLDAQPDQKVLLTEVTKDTPAEQKPTETFMDAVTAILEREKLDPVEGFDQAVQLAMREKPHLYNYGVAGQQGS